MSSPSVTQEEYNRAAALRLVKALDKANQAMGDDTFSSSAIEDYLWAIACELRVANAIALVNMRVPPELLRHEEGDE